MRGAGDRPGRGARCWESLDREPLRELVPELDWPLLHPARRRAPRRSRCLADAPRPPRAAAAAARPAGLRQRARALPAAPRAALGQGQAGDDRLRLERHRRRHDRPALRRQGARAPRLGRHGLPRRHAARPVRRAVRAARVGGGRRPPGRRAQPAARAARPRHARTASSTTRRSPRRSSDVWIACSPTSCTSTTCTTSARRCIDVAAARGVPSYFTTHNYWLVCPRAYLLRGDSSLCGGPGDARRRLRLVRRRRRADPTATSSAWTTIRDALLARDHRVPGRLGRRAPHADRPGLPGRRARRRPPGGARRRTRSGSASAATARPGRVGDAR